MLEKASSDHRRRQNFETLAGDAAREVFFQKGSSAIAEVPDAAGFCLRDVATSREAGSSILRKIKHHNCAAVALLMRRCNAIGAGTLVTGWTFSSDGCYVDAGF